MYQRTYFDKCATIVGGSEYNTGLNPVSELLWGRNTSKFLIHFDHSKLESLVSDKTYADMSKLHHVLKITNAASLDMSELHKIYESQIDGDSKRRASSFDLIFFLIPDLWDGGKGFDYNKTFFNTDFYDKKSYDYSLYKLKEGVNWYQSRNGYKWEIERDYTKTKNELFYFYLKSDKKVIGGLGDEITFRYYAECNNNFCNTKLQFKQINGTINSSIEIGTPIYFAKNGQICYTDEQKARYCNYVEISVKIPENTTSYEKKYSFRIQTEAEGKTFKSTAYKITQLTQSEKFYPQTCNGIYSTKTLEDELNKFNLGQDSIVIAKQHFDVGNENIEVDITSTVNKFITGELANYGIGIAYSPTQEYSESIYENYIGLLTNKTNSFFEPYLETTYDGIIEDDRANFILGKDNKLYLYSNIGGKLVNLDQLPICSVNGNDYEVKQESRGVYYIDINIPTTAYTSPTMLYDVWDNLVYNGNQLPTVELEFTTQNPYTYFGVGTSLPEKNNFTPTCYGISDNERIKRGDIRKLGFLIKKNYTQNQAVTIDGIYMRMYVMDGTAQYDVMPYTKVNKAFAENFVMIDTSILIPNRYYVDVKIVYGMEAIEHHDVLHFEIVNDANNMYN